MSDDLVKRLREGNINRAARDLIDRYFRKSDKCLASIPARPDVDADLVLCAGLEEAADRIEALTKELDEAADRFDATDRIEGGACSAIRELLKSAGVPQATYIDDCVANAVFQRDEARARVKVLEEALREVAASNGVLAKANASEWQGKPTLKKEFVRLYDIATAALQPEKEGQS